MLMDLDGHGFCVELDVFKGENKTEILYIYMCVCVCVCVFESIADNSQS